MQRSDKLNSFVVNCLTVSDQGTVSEALLLQVIGQTPRLLFFLGGKVKLELRLQKPGFVGVCQAIT